MATINTINNSCTAADLTVPAGTITSSGDIETTAGNLILPATAAAAGQLKINGNPVFHAFRGVFAGTNAGNFAMTGSSNSVMGDSAGANIVNCLYLTAVGAAAVGNGAVNSAAIDTVAIGYKALYSLVASTGNVAVGSEAMSGATVPGTGNVAIGYQTLLNCSGHRNVAVGETSMSGDVVTGSYNVAVGRDTLLSATSAQQNVVLGDSAYSVGDPATGSYNVIAGASAGLNITSGDYNVGIGSSSLPITTGDRNIAIGYAVASNYTTSESSNIIIGEATGTATEDNKIRIGVDGSGTGQQNACYIAGIYGVTPGGTVGYALVDSNGQLGSATRVTSTAWTPALEFGGASVDITYGTQTASYTRVDSIVTFNLNIILTNKGSSNGAATITGIPVSSGATTALAVYYSKLTALGMVTATITGATISIFSADAAGGAVAALTDAGFANDTSISISGTYIV